MKKWLLASVLLSLLVPSPAFSQPMLQVQLLDRQNRQNIRISWPAMSAGFALEQSSALGTAGNWQAVSGTPVPQNDRLTVTLPSSSAAQFFRLRQSQGPTLTSITETSPVDGEAGVAVTRETIVHFSGALAANAVIKTNNFYATSAGRRILSRIELSSDRTKATLFYLEPLPGSARVNVFFDAEGLTDLLGQPLDPAGTGQANGLKVISFETLSLIPLTGTAVIGRVFASELQPGSDTGTNAVNKPLVGVTITVDGMEQSIRAVTDAQGNFTLNNCPAGRFFVHIDGRTVRDEAAGIRYPDRAYYPFVGKAWDTVAGRTDNKAGGTGEGEIYLPRITAGTLQTVSATEDTTISFPASVVAANPALAGVTITVPANSLFSDDGNRGGKVGIAPVPPDRLPGPLPPGLEMPLVITVQSDGGLNFDRPAPICFPNLPDPVLKAPLPAGSKQSLISFNHDKGIWEAAGSMTVSADGKFICTDPGAGILQPGWHGVGPDRDEPPDCGNVCCPDEDDDEPLEALSLPELDARSGRVQKARPRRPRPSQCREKPCYPTAAAVERCKKNCSFHFHVCNDEAWTEVISRRYRCELKYPFPPGETNHKNYPLQLKCQDLAWNRMLFQRLRCREEYDACNKDCDECTMPAGFGLSREARRSAKLAGPEVAIRDELDAIFQQVSELMRRLAATPPPVPPDLLSQIENLFQQVDAVTGGDAEGYLNSQIIAAEEEIAAYAREIGYEPDELNPGNAPPYPVLYAATIERPGDLVVFRGETSPFGQYSLFIPRDGTLLDVSFYDPRTKEFGLISPYRSPNARFDLPRFTLSALPNGMPDSDGDGLPDLVEDVFGTDPEKADSDDDGIADGAEVDQGTNPLDGVPIRTGIVGTAGTPGSAVDVATANDLLAVAQGTTGVSVFNIFNSLNPVLIAHVDTPGTAQAVAMSGNLIAVADGDPGLAIIDVSDPANARIVHQVRLGGNAQAVAAAGRVAYAAYASPQFPTQPAVLAKVDLVTGNVLERLSLIVPFGSFDVSVAGDQVYVLAPPSLLIHGETTGGLSRLGQLANVNAQRLFVGGGLAYLGQASGHSVIDVSDAAMPLLIGVPPSFQLGLQELVTTGSGLLVATTVFVQGSQDVALYDSSQPTKVTSFLTLFETPGDARALAIHNGFAYVADSAAGIQVINYSPFDKNKVPPSIALTTSAAGSEVESSTPLRVTANATDDVQVRNVEFYIDGQNVFSDGNFPFEYRFDAPAFTAAKTSFTLRARAIDTGGNFTWSDELTIQLGPDVTPPRLMATTPFGGAKSVNSVFAYFNEPMNPATLTAASVQLISAGGDGLLDTADDLPVGGGAVAYHAENYSVSLDFAAPLADGLYRAVVMTAAADVAGNRTAGDFAWQFRVADAVFWTRSTDGLWEDASNWSSGAVPGPTDNVFIESIPGDVTITHASGTSIIRSLLLGERMAIAGSSTLQVSDTIELHQPLTMNGGTLKGGTVSQRGEGKLLFGASVVNTLDGVSVEGDLVLTNTSARVLIRNGLTLAGNVLLDNGAAMSFAEDQTFNTSQVIFAGNSGALGIEPGTTLTLGPAMVVQGKTGF
ncbi:MAG: Ig-like domain-containing protein, partial [Verrucomicrobiales bacterium]|nr:Ig-like domain-containing protein [Verrucomicrobiales bacterium]